MTLNREKIDIEMARNQYNITILAEKCGISRARIYTVLNSRSVLPATVGKIATALNVDVLDIIEN